MKLSKLMLAMTGIIVLGGCGGDGDSGSLPPNMVPENQQLPDPTIKQEMLDFNDLAVHDPSIIKADDTYYVFGSHLAAAKSTDLMNWQYLTRIEPVLDANGEPVLDDDNNPVTITRIANAPTDQNPLFNTVSSEMAAAFKWTGDKVQGSWAPDVIKLKDGKYYFYYDFCNNPDDPVYPTPVCNAPRSFIGVAVADAIEGPYVDKGVFLRSGLTADEITQGLGPDGVTAYNGGTMPNTIDPAVFYDKDGQLWMTYGSYFGGIWIIKIDETTAKPFPNQGYGKRLTGGEFAANEGSYILYSPDANYYYLFTSIGGFAANGGYNIRVSRSENPDGPYVDASGFDMTQVYKNPEEHGNKILGGFEFVAEKGDTGSTQGYLSPGHNSAYFDKNTGKYFLVTHTRFPNRDEQHSVRVHEMFINADGWLVVSPHRYAPINGDNVVDALDLVGDYRFINFEKDTNTSPKTSVYLTLTESRLVKGEVTGKYRLYDNEPNRITLTLDNLGTFEGTLAWQWDETFAKLVPTFSALSNEGVTVWGSKLLDKTSEQLLTDIGNSIDVVSEATGGVIALPTRGTRGATIEWRSSDATVIHPDGTVVRPNVGEGDKVVTLTATIMVNGKKVTKTYQVTVFARKTYNRIAQYSFENNLTDSLGLFAAGQPTGDRIFKAADSVSYSMGLEGEALTLDGAHGVLLPTGIISSYEYTVSFWANPTVITGFSTAFFGAVNEETAADDGKFSNTWISMLPQGWDGNTMFWSNGSAWFDGVTGERIPENTWSHVAFSVSNGLVRVFINGVEKFSRGNLSDYFSGQQGVFGLGVNYWDLPYNGLIDELKVYEAALTAGEVKALDIDKLPDSELLASAVDILDLGDLSSVRENLHLPVTGPYAAAITWVSSDPTIIDTTGGVTQPGREDTDKVVTLTATIKLGQATQTKVFTANVKSMAPPTPVAIYSFEDNLTDGTAHFGAGTVVGNLIGTTGGTITYTDGAVGKAAVFDGKSGIELPNNLITDNSYSVSLWLNPKVLNKYTSALFSYASASSWTSVLPGGQNDYEHAVLWSGEAWYDGRTSFTMPKETWSHMVYTVNGGDVKVYINGNLLFTGANFPNVFSVPTTKFAVGVNFWDIPFTGLVDEIKFYDEAITEQDVQDLFGESNQ